MSITVHFGINYTKILTSCDDKNGMFSKLRLINGYGSLNRTLRCFANSALFNEIETEKKLKQTMGNNDQHFWAHTKVHQCFWQAYIFWMLMVLSKMIFLMGHINKQQLFYVGAKWILQTQLSVKWIDSEVILIFSWNWCNWMSCHHNF